MACQGASIPLAEVTGPTVRVVRNGWLIAMIDASPWADAVGYVFAVQGREPEHVAHDVPEQVLARASAYFGTELSADP